jgi:hypothetical protein
MIQKQRQFVQRGCQRGIDIEVSGVADRQ